jgi:2-polyprenyl-6-methoxyphenol hydroxylase-like FAD-dependent oxidoreductase
LRGIEKLTELEAQDGKWLLRFENDTTTTADLVIGANGGMSAIRKYVTDATIEYTGTLILQGDVSQPETACGDFYKLCNDNRLMAAGDGTLLVANPKNGDLLSYGVIFKMPDNWSQQNDTEGLSNFLLNRLSTWHESYKQLFRATSDFVIWLTRKIPVQRPWKTNRPLPITLIGDAAHIMPPLQAKA